MRKTARASRTSRILPGARMSDQLAVKIIFPWGRYYAHPWGLNPVRLREAEWPPSPWRLLRALAASWFRSNAGHPLSSEAVALIEGLGRALPDIGFGKITFGQTVHYQPNFGATDDKDYAQYKKTRHENHFAAVHGPVIFNWPNLPLSHENLLRELLAALSYFGRAESICKADLVTAKEMEAIAGIGWCRPASGRKISARCRDVFCPNTSDFRVSDLWARRSSPSVGSNAPPHLILFTPLSPSSFLCSCLGSYRMTQLGTQMIDRLVAAHSICVAQGKPSEPSQWGCDGKMCVI